MLRALAAPDRVVALASSSSGRATATDGCCLPLPCLLAPLASAVAWSIGKGWSNGLREGEDSELQVFAAASFVLESDRGNWGESVARYQRRGN